VTRILVLLFSIIVLVGCAENSGVHGRIGARLKGKDISVQAFYLNPGKSPQERPTVNVRNDSQKDYMIFPMTVTAWFKQAGKKERTFAAGDLAGNAQISPQKEVMLPGDLFNFDVAPGDELDKLRLSMANGQEVFTINP